MATTRKLELNLETVRELSEDLWAPHHHAESGMSVGIDMVHVVRDLQRHDL
jgi:hypothetical protein